MFHALLRLFKQLVSHRKKPATPAPATKAAAQTQPQTPSVNEEEVRKRLEGLGYIE